MKITINSLAPQCHSEHSEESLNFNTLRFFASLRMTNGLIVLNDNNFYLTSLLITPTSLHHYIITRFQILFTVPPHTEIVNENISNLT